MNVKNYKTVLKLFRILLLLLVPFYLLRCTYFSDHVKPSKTPQYVGKETCINCHKKEYHDWKGSDHDLAMDFANDSTVLGNFDNAVLPRNKQTHKAYKKDDKFYAYTDGEDGEMHEYEVKYVFGHYPLQNYLVEFPGGRLQTLALTWNSKDSNWFYMADSVYQSMSVTHNNWLHWTNQAQNWNSMCADCHSTNLKKGYNQKTDSYHTTWSEIDVSCEACHGPASEHVRWANLSKDDRKGISNYGLPIKTSGIDNKQYVDNCARCHARRANFGDYDAKSNNIYNYIQPALPTEPNWYIDGQIHSEDYVYGSFTQSKMYMHGVQCNNCHNVHSGKLRLQGNALCLQCHLADYYDTKAHTFHKSYGEKGTPVISKAGVKFDVGSGTQCINCHMHGQNYMGVDYRRDHSFRIPRPDLSEKFGTPNACNQCHKDKTNKWAQKYIEKWYGKTRPYHYGEAFFDAKTGVKNADLALRKIINSDSFSAPIQSVAVSWLTVNDSTNTNLEKRLLQSPKPLVRITSAQKIPINSKESLDQLLTLLNDSLKAVRLAAFQLIMDVDTNMLSLNQKKSFKKVKQEQFQMLLYNSDFPVGKYNLGNYYQSQKQYKKAVTMYLEALKQDAELSYARMNLAHLYAVIGKPTEAEAQLKQYVKENPDDVAGLYNYGLILSENKKYKQSLSVLVKANMLAPKDDRINFNIAMLFEFYGSNKDAEKYLKQRITNNPDYLDAYIDLLKFYMRIKEADKIKPLMEATEQQFPDRQSIERIHRAVFQR